MGQPAELDDHCDKLAVERRSSEVLSTLADRRRSRLSRSERPPRRAKLRARFDVRPILSPEFREVPEGSTLIFGGKLPRISL